MQKNNGNYKIQRQALAKYIATQFNDYDPPPLEQFVNFKRHSQIIQIDNQQPFSSEITQSLLVEAILYLHSGAIELFKKEGKSWRREIEFKQGSFFTLVNYKNINSLEPEWYKLVAKMKATISILPIRPSFCYQQMRLYWYKKTILSKIFYFNDQDAENQKKKLKFNEFIAHFQYQSFRRDTRIVVQGRKNQKVFIIAKGQAKLYKHLKVSNNSKGLVQKNVQILYLSEGAIFGCELFLINSKAIHSIISNHGTRYEQIREQKEDQGEQQMQDSPGIKKGRKGLKSRFSKIEVQSGGYDLYNPHQNVSNFTIVAESANVEIYFIELDKLVTVITERLKSNFLRCIQSSYITILRRTYEKMTIELKKEQEKVAGNHSRMEILAARAYSTEGRSTGQVREVQPERLSLKKSEINMATTSLNKLRNEEVWKSQNQFIDKKTSLLSKQTKRNEDYKQKILAVIEEKLNFHAQKDIERLTQDLTEIFMKKNEGRSEDIEKQHKLLEKKKIILEKRGGWKLGWNQLKQEGLLTTQRRYSTAQLPNYLVGLKVEQFTEKVKIECSNKIHQTNKIKQQFMKIKSECPCCSCYQNFENFSSARRSMTSMGRTGYKTAEGWGSTSKTSLGEESLETVYNKMRFLNDRTKQKYNHNKHLLQVRRNRDKLERRASKG